MFVRTQHLIDAIRAAGEAQASLAELRAIRASQDTTIDWLRARVNQLEKERAVLLREVTHLNIPTVEIARSTGNAMSPTIPPGMALPSFDDVGDAAAEQLGIGHDNNGEILYRD